MMISRLQILTLDLDRHSHAEQAEAACLGGADWIQFRSKGPNPKEILRDGHKVLAVCRKHGARMIVNDDPLLAKTLGADGVHLGRKDASPKEARKILGPEAIVGGTAHNADELLNLQKSAVDYIGLGPLRSTKSKKDLAPLLGLEGVRGLLCDPQEKPVVIIGGVEKDDVKKVLAAGAHGVAVAGAVANAQNPKASVREFLEEL